MPTKLVTGFVCSICGREVDAYEVIARKTKCCGSYSVLYEEYIKDEWPLFSWSKEEYGNKDISKT